MSAPKQRPDAPPSAAAPKGGTLPWGTRPEDNAPADSGTEDTLLDPETTPDGPTVMGTLDRSGLDSAERSAGPDPRAAAESRSTSAPAVTVLPRVSFLGSQPALEHTEKTRYQIVDQIGEGGVGEVLEAKDHDIGRRVALKRLRADVASLVALARFVEEIRTTGRLEHPNIVPIHDVGVDDEGRYYFIMKYVHGETLETIIARLREGDRDYHERYGFERRVEIFKGILAAVSYAHSVGFIHRDIKPANIMVGEFGEVMVMDWGIAKPVAPGDRTVDDSVLRSEGAAQSDAQDRPFATQVGALIGTPAYMAPEQASGEPADERTDVYSLCVVLHEFLTLQHYLAGRRTVADTLAGVRDAAVPRAAFVNSPHQPAVPADLTWFIDAGIAKDPAQRYPSVEAMLHRLDRRAEGDIPVQCPMTAMKLATNCWLHVLDSHPFLVVGLAVLTVLTALAGIGYGVSRLL